MRLFRSSGGPHEPVRHADALRQRRLSLGLTLAAVVASVSPDTEAQNRLVTKRADGATIEVYGLRRWTLPMLADSLAKRGVTGGLGDAACAAVLRYQLGFPDAAVTEYHRADGPPFVVVALVEPADSVRVRYRSMPLDSVRPREEWAEAVAIARRAPWVFEGMLRSELRMRRIAAGMRDGTPGGAAPDTSAAARLARFLRARTSPGDLRVAQETLEHDPNMHNRMVAAALLLNFGERPEAWYALVETLRESDGLAKVIAMATLDALARDTTRRIDWRPKAGTLHALLDGTSLSMTPRLMRVLVATGVGPADARILLRGGGALPVAFLASEQPMLRTQAHELLRALAGRDLGPDSQTWREWIAAL